jgi:hypothetical protein
MARLLDAAYQTLRAAEKVANWAYRLVDLLWSVVFAAVKVGGGSILGAIVALAIQAFTILFVYRCFFPLESFARTANASSFAWFILNFPIISAFLAFFVGESIVVVIIWTILWSLLHFELKFVFGTRERDEQDFYSPIGGETADAEDLLTF